MRRGTTPTLTIRIRDGDLAEYEHIYVTIKQGEKELTKIFAGSDSVDGVLHVTLTQEDTLMFADNEKAKVQLRCITADGIAVATNIVRIYVGEILKEGVIE